MISTAAFAKRPFEGETSTKLFYQTGSSRGGSLVQFIKFGIVGASNTLVSLGIYYIFIVVNRHFYILGNTAGFFISVLNSYFWNNRYVFKKSGRGHLRPLIKTYICYGSTFLLGTGLLYLMVHHFGVSEWIAPIVSLIVTIPLNFVLNKFWAFK